MDGTAIGWGSTSYDNVPSMVPMKADIPIVPYDVCVDEYWMHGDDAEFGSKSQLCAGTPGVGVGGCFDDAGGPLMCDGKQCGIFVYGNCGEDENKPGVYTNVSYFMDWITENWNPESSA